ncbi:MAG: multidrug ABC transporter [Clostridia bacterium]|nr:multidrug ABC transporter [Clostridia bacterium]
MINVLPLAVALSAVCVASVSQLLLKSAANRTYPSLLRQYLNVYVIVGYGLMVLSTLLFILSYRLGLHYKSGPVLEALGYPLILIFSYLLFREPLTKRKIIGNLIIICGIVIFHL